VTANRRDEVLFVHSVNKCPLSGADVQPRQIEFC
jgi:hypothetical protein